MTASALAVVSPIPRNAAGEPPLGIGGLAFRDDQGEIIVHPDERFRSPAARIGVLELEGGLWWLSYPFRVDGEVFPSRAAALEASIDAVVAKARKYMANGEGEGTHWTEAYGNAVIDWALSLKAVKEDLVQAASEPTEPAIDHPTSENAAASADGRVTDDPGSEYSGGLNPVTDPVIAELMAAKRARKTWPAGHSFSMTNPIVNGEMMTVGTCECGAVLSYKWGRYERMDAAVEAHWQKFDSSPDKVDGRGQPIKAGEAAQAPSAKKSRRKKEISAAPQAPEHVHGNAGDTPELAIAALPEPALSDGSSAEGAGSPLSELAEFPGWNAVEDFRAIARGEADTVDRETIRHYVGTGYVHATTTRLVLTEQGEALLKHSPTRADTKCEACEPAPIGAASEVADGANMGPGPIPASASFSDADRSDYVALRALAGGQPIDEVTLADLIKRGLAHELRPGDWMPTKQGFERGQALMDHFWKPPTPEEIRERSRADEEHEPAQICAGSDEYLAGIMARDEEGGGFPVAAAPLNAEETGGLGTTDNMASTGPEPVAADQHAAAKSPGGVARSHAPPAFLSDSAGAADTAFSGDDDALLQWAEANAWREPPTYSETLRALLDFSKVYGGGAPKRPALRWHGGKWMLAPWIISYFPNHDVYVEPFGGTASVMLRKQPSTVEVYNDLDDEVVGFFHVLRDRGQAEKLIELLHLTPYSRREYELSYEWSDDPVEQARRLAVRSFMGFGSNAHATSVNGRGTGFRANSNRSGGPPARDWTNYPKGLAAIVQRFAGVIVECRDAITSMRQHDGPDVLHYVDPPYVPETRAALNHAYAKKGMYRHELDRDAHAQLLSDLKGLRGMVVLSGYPDPLYDDALPDWRRVECDAMADGASPRTEVLWLNPACVAALDAQHPRLFDLAQLDVANIPPPTDIEA